MAQKIGIWGCLALGLVMIIGTIFLHGFDDPIRFVGGISLLMFGAAFWLTRKNAQLAEEEYKRDQS